MYQRGHIRRLLYYSSLLLGLLRHGSCAGGEIPVLLLRNRKLVSKLADQTRENKNKSKKLGRARVIESFALRMGTTL